MEKYLRVNLLGSGPRLIKKNLPGRGLKNVEKHWFRLSTLLWFGSCNLYILASLL